MKNKKKIIRRSKSEIIQGKVFEFRPYPYKFIMYLEKWGIQYEIIEKYNGYIIEILDDSKYECEEMYRRYPRYIVRNNQGFEPSYVSGIKSKDKDPNIYKKYQELRQRFIECGRNMSVYCTGQRNHQVALEVCICRCKKKCNNLNLRYLVGKNEGMYEYMNDFLKLQRLVNILYGTVRKRDVKIIK